MDYLTLCKRAVIEAGTSGVNGLTTTADARGEWLRFVTWVNQAWLDIQTERDDWLFMRKSKAFNLIPNQAEYNITTAPLSITDYGSWVDDSFRIYLTDPNREMRISQMAFIPFRDTYLIGSLRVSYSMPTVVSVSPTQSLIFALPPDSAYTVIADYQRTPQSLTLDSSVPDMPERFHMMIVYRALQLYGAYESYPEKFTHAQEEYKRLMRRLEIDQLPELLRVGRF